LLVSNIRETIIWLTSYPVPLPAMKIVNVSEARAHLSALIAAAEAGEEVIISRANKPVVKLVPVEPEKQAKRAFGLHQDQPYYIAPDFDGPLPEEFWLGHGPA
jgi:prevent-host-death family protein